MPKNMDRNQRRYLADKFAKVRLKQLSIAFPYGYTDKKCHISEEQKFIWELRGLRCACDACEKRIEAKEYGQMRKNDIYITKHTSSKIGNSRKRWWPSRHGTKLRKMDDMVKEQLEEIPNELV